MKSKLRRIVRNNNKQKKTELENLLDMKRKNYEQIQTLIKLPSTKATDIINKKIRKNLKNLKKQTLRRAQSQNQRNDEIDELNQTPISRANRRVYDKMSRTRSFRVNSGKKRKRHLELDDYDKVNQSYNAYDRRGDGRGGSYSRSVTGNRSIDKDFLRLQPNRKLGHHNRFKNSDKEKTLNMTKVIMDKMTGRTQRAQKFKSYRDHKIVKETIFKGFKRLVEQSLGSTSNLSGMSSIGGKSRTGNLFLAGVDYEKSDKSFIKNSTLNRISGIRKKVTIASNTKDEILEVFDKSPRKRSPLKISKGRSIVSANSSYTTIKGEEGKDISEDVITYIKMLINGETEPDEFIYAVFPDASNPYGIMPVSFPYIQQNSIESYYTISKRGVTKYKCYKNDNVENEKIEKMKSKKLNFTAKSILLETSLEKVPDDIEEEGKKCRTHAKHLHSFYDEDRLAKIEMKKVRKKEKGYAYAKKMKQNLKYKAVEFTPLQEFIKAKDQFDKLRTLSFITKFRKIKTLKAWRLSNIKFKRFYQKKKLELNLPLLNRKIQPNILRIRDLFFNIEKLKFFVFTKNSIFDFEEIQQLQEYTMNHAKELINKLRQEYEFEVESIVKDVVKEMWDTSFEGLTTDMIRGLKNLGGYVDEEDNNTGISKFSNLKLIESASKRKAMRFKAVTLKKVGIKNLSLENLNFYGKQNLPNEHKIFLEKLLQLNIPFDVKTILRDYCHQILKLPYYFDFMGMSSLLKCYKFNMDRMQGFLIDCQHEENKNDELWAVNPYTGEKNSLKKVFPFLKVNLSLREDVLEGIKKDKEESKILDVKISKDGSNDEFSSEFISLSTQLSEKYSLQFDVMSNIKYLNNNLPDPNYYENDMITVNYISLDRDKLSSEYIFTSGNKKSKLKSKKFKKKSQLKTIIDLQSAEIHSLNLPSTIKLSYIQNIANSCLEVSPSKLQVYDYYKHLFNEFLENISLFLRCEETVNFDLFYAILFKWENKDYKPWWATSVGRKSLKLRDNKMRLQINTVYGEKNFEDDFRNKIWRLFGQSFEVIDNLIPKMDPIINQHYRNTRVTGEIFLDEFKNFSFFFEGALRSLDRIIEVSANNLRNGIEAGILLCSTENFSEKMYISCKKMMTEITNVIPDHLKRRLMQIINWLRIARLGFTQNPKGLKEFVVMKYRVKVVTKGLLKIKETLLNYEGALKMMKLYSKIKVSEVISLFQDADMTHRNLLNFVLNLDATFSKNEGVYEKITLKKIETMKTELEGFYEEILNPKYLEIGNKADTTLKIFEDFKTKFKDLKREATNYSNYVKFLKIQPRPDFTITKLIYHSLKYRTKLWSYIKRLNQNKREWEPCQIKHLNLKGVDSFLETSEKQIKELEKNLPESTCFNYFKKCISQYKKLSPLVKAMISPYLKPRHNKDMYDLWERVLKKLKYEDIVEEDDPENDLNDGIKGSSNDMSLGSRSRGGSYGNLRKSTETQKSEKKKQSLIDHVTMNEVKVMELLKIKTSNISPKIIQISIKAMYESLLIDQLEAVKDEWKRRKVPISSIPNKSLVILGDMKNFFKDLDESLMTISNILSNKYVGVIKNKTEDYQSLLLKIYNTLEKLQQLQEKWSFLEEIYSNSDLRKNMANDSQLFDSSSRALFGIFKKIDSKNMVMQLLKIKQIEDNIGKISNTFENLFMNIDVYLNKKREEFTRLFLLTNEEMLDLLSKINESSLIIDKYCHKMFEGVKNLDFSEQEEGTIYGLIGDFNENIKFSRGPINSKVSIEILLSGLQKSIHQTISKNILKCYDEIAAGEKMQEIITKYPGQCSIVAYWIFWCKMIDGVLKSQDLDMLYDQIEVDETNLETLIVQSREKTTSLSRVKYNNLIKTFLHQRDIVEEILVNKVLTNADFVWKKQIKYSLSKDMADTRTVDIECLDIVTAYMNEYIGNKDRLVVTPLLSECWSLTILSLNSKMGIVLNGNSGEGKTETVKELSRFFGQYCVTTNCSEEMNQPSIFRFLQGTVQPGIWACFDSYDKLSPTVLESVSQIIVEIKQCLQRFSLSCKSQISVKSSNRKKPTERLRTPQKEDEKIKSQHNLGDDLKTDSRSFTGDVPSSLKLEINNQVLRISTNHSIFLITSFSSKFKRGKELPSNIREMMRVFSMVQPSTVIIIENLLLSEGFTDARPIAISLDKFMEFSKLEISYSDDLYSSKIEKPCRIRDTGGFGPFYKDGKEFDLAVGNSFSSQKQNCFKMDLSFLKRVVKMASDLNNQTIEDLKGSQRKEFTRRKESYTDVESLLAKGKIDYSKFSETQKVIISLSKLVLPLIPESKHLTFKKLIKNIFGTYPQIEKENEIVEKFASNILKGKYNIEPSKNQLEKVSSIYDLINSRSSIALIGESLSGKTTLYETALAVFNQLSKEDLFDENQKRFFVNDIIYSRAYSPKQLFGGFSNGDWKDGVFTHKIKKLMKMYPFKIDTDTRGTVTIRDEKKIYRFMAFDGLMCSSWLDYLNPIMDESRFYSLPNSERIKIPENTKFVFMSESLNSISPGSLSRIGFVMLNIGEYRWKDYLKARFEEYYYKNSSFATKALMLKINSIMALSLDNLFSYKRKPLEFIIDVSPIDIVMNIWLLIENLFDQFSFKRPDGGGIGGIPTNNISKITGDSDDTNQGNQINLLTFSYLTNIINYGIIVGLGMLTKESYHSSISSIFMQKLSNLNLGAGSNSSDILKYRLNLDTFQFESIDMSERKLVDSSEYYKGALKHGRIIVMSPRMLSYVKLLDYCVNTKLRFALIGTQDSGKSTILEEMYSQRGRLTSVHRITFSFFLDSNAKYFQDNIEKDLIKKSKMVFSTKARNGTSVLIEDINLPILDEPCAVEALEMMRSLFERGEIFDSNDYFDKQYDGVTFASTIRMRSKNSPVVLPRNMRKNWLLIHLSSILNSTLRNTIYQTLLRSLPDVINRREFSPFVFSQAHDESLLKLAVLDQGTGSSQSKSRLSLRKSTVEGFKRNTKRLQIPYEVKNFARFVTDSVVSIFLRIQETFKIDSVYYYLDFGIHNLQNMVTNLTSLRGVNNTSEYIGHLVYEIEREFGDSLDEHLDKSMLQLILKEHLDTGNYYAHRAQISDEEASSMNASQNSFNNPMKDYRVKWGTWFKRQTKAQKKQEEEEKQVPNIELKMSFKRDKKLYSGSLLKTQSFGSTQSFIPSQDTSSHNRLEASMEISSDSIESSQKDSVGTSNNPKVHRNVEYIDHVDKNTFDNTNAFISNNDISYVNKKTDFNFDANLAFLKQKFEEMHMDKNSQLMLFEEAEEYISKIARIVKRHEGHMLIYGPPGRGKVTLSKFASSLLDMEFEVLSFDSLGTGKKFKSKKKVVDKNLLESADSKLTKNEKIIKENFEKIEKFKTILLEAFIRAYAKYRPINVIIRLDSPSNSNLTKEVLKIIKCLIVYKDMNLICKNSKELRDFERDSSNKKEANEDNYNLSKALQNFIIRDVKFTFVVTTLYKQTKKILSDFPFILKYSNLIKIRDWNFEALEAVGTSVLNILGQDEELNQINTLKDRADNLVAVENADLVNENAQDADENGKSGGSFIEKNIRIFMLMYRSALNLNDQNRISKINASRHSGTIRSGDSRGGGINSHINIKSADQILEENYSKNDIALEFNSPRSGFNQNSGVEGSTIPSIKSSSKAKFFKEKKNLPYGPYTYIKSLDTFVKLFKSKSQSVLAQKRILKTGISRVKVTEKMINDIDLKLEVMNKQLVESNRMIEALLKQISSETAQVSKNEKKVFKVIERIRQQKEKIELEKKSLDMELEHLGPALRQAETALNNISKSDIGELRTFITPPAAVQNVMDAVCLVLNEEQTWPTAKKILNDFYFIQRLKDFDKQKMPDEMLKQLQDITDDEEFDPDFVGEKSVASQSLCIWVLAVERYASEFQNMRPKIELVEKKNEEIEELKVQLEKNNQVLDEVKEKLAQSKFKQKKVIAKKMGIVEEQRVLQERMQRAQVLTKFLKDEKEKWKEQVDVLESKENMLHGDMILASGLLVYNGILDLESRSRLKEMWLFLLDDNDIIHSSNFRIENAIYDQLKLNNWLINSLPNNRLSIENAVIFEYTNIKPKVIFDPNDECLQWAMKNFNDAIYVTSSEDKNKIKKLQYSLEEGAYLGYQNAFSKASSKNQIFVSSLLSSLIARKTRINQNQEAIKIGNIDYQFNRKFCLLIFTKNESVLENYNLNIKTEILNFGVYEEGFQERLIKVVLEIEGGEAEKSRLENNKYLLERINKVTNNQKIVLNRLNKHNDYTLLDDTEFVQVLQTSEIDNKQIEQEIELRKEMKEKIKDQRMYLKEFTRMVTCLYYTFKNLDGEIIEGSEISPQLFLSAFRKVLALNENISSIKDYSKEETIMKTIELLYSALSKGISKEDRLFYAVSFGVKTLRSKGAFSEHLWEYATKLKKSQDGEEDDDFMDTESTGVWANVKKLRTMIPHLSMEDLPKFAAAFKPREGENLLESIYHSLSKPDFMKYSSIEKLAICKAFVPENFLTSLQIFSKFTNGDLVDSKNFRTLADMFVFSDFYRPVVCYMDKGMDIAQLCDDLKKKTYSPGYKIIFCGSDPFEKCEKYLEKAMINGYFVVINSIHLNPDWERKLANWLGNLKLRRAKSESQEFRRKKKAKLDESSNFLNKKRLIKEEKSIKYKDSLYRHYKGNKKPFKRFRILITTKRSHRIDESLLENCYQFTFENSQNFKSNYLETLNIVDIEEYEKEKNVNWRRFVVNFVYLYCLIGLRNRFSKFGFFSEIEVNISDMKLLLDLMRCASSSKFNKEKLDKSSQKKGNTTTDIVLDDALKARKIGMLRAVHREIMKLVFRSKVHNLVDFNILKSLIYRHLEELEYSDKEVSLTVEGKGIVLNGKRIKDLKKLIKRLPVNYKKETGVHLDSLFAFSKIEGVKTIKKVKAIEKDKYTLNKKKSKYSSTTILNVPSILQNRNTESVIGKRMVDFNSQINIAAEKKLSNLIEYIQERLPDYVEVPDFEKDPSMLTNVQNYIVKELKSFNELIFDIESCLIKLKDEVSGVKTQTKNSYQILTELSKGKIPYEWLSVINEDKLWMFKKSGTSKSDDDLQRERLNYEKYIDKENLDIEQQGVFDLYLNILKDKSDYLTTISSSLYGQKYAIDLSKLQHPQSLIKAMQLDFSLTRGPDVDFHDIKVNFKLLNIFDLEDQILEEETYVIYNLKLQNAFYDKVSGSIADSLEPGYQKNLPLVSVTARYGRDIHERGNRTYFNCPIFAGVDQSKPICHIKFVTLDDPGTHNLRGAYVVSQ